jgi:hypothetical protein
VAGAAFATTFSAQPTSAAVTPTINANLCTGASRAFRFGRRPDPIEHATRHIRLDARSIPHRYLTVNVPVSIQPRKSIAILGKREIEFQRDTLPIQREA